MTRTLKALLTFLALCSATVGAIAQQPITLPANTVYGRLGVSPGPGQAIPFATLGPLLGITPSQPIFNVTSSPYNAACNFVTDDRAAIQAALTAAAVVNGVVAFPGNGLCRIAGSLNITAGMTLQGSDAQQSGLYPDVGVTAIVINTGQPVVITGMGIQYPSAASAGVAGVQVTATTENPGSVFSNMYLSNCAVCFSFLRANTFRIENVTIGSFQQIGIYVQNSNNADSGDSSITASSLVSTVSAAKAIQWASSGGLRISNTKIIAPPDGTGIDINLINGAVTGDIFINNVGIEGTTTGPSIKFSRQGATGSIRTISIEGGQTSGTNGILIPVDASGSWIRTLSIVGVLHVGLGSGSPVFATINSTAGFLVANNVVNSNTAATVMVTTGASADKGMIGPNRCDGTCAVDSIASTNTTRVVDPPAPFVIGDIFYADSVSSTAKLADVATGNALISGGVGAAPAWGKVALTTHVSGILPGANGGTNNGFLQFSGPATSLKTKTISNANDTIAELNVANIFTQAQTIAINGATALSLGASGTNFVAQTINNTGGSMIFGVERSTGGAFAGGSAAYASVISSANTNTALQFGTATSPNTPTIRLSIAAGAAHVSGVGTAPALTSCGTTPAITGNDIHGTVTMGTGTPTGCVLTFNVAYVAAPDCVVIWQGTPLAAQNYTVSTTAITLVQTATSSNKVTYTCHGA